MPMPPQNDMRVAKLGFQAGVIHVDGLRLDRIEHFDADIDEIRDSSL